MSNKKSLIISFLITAVYFGLSLIYFFGGKIDSRTNNSFSEAAEFIFTFPALVIFGVGFGSGNSEAFIAGLILFIFIWGIAYIFTKAVSIMLKS